MDAARHPHLPHPFQPQGADEEQDPPRRLPSRLWEELKADPLRAPEHIARAASDVHGPAAETWLAAKRERYAPHPRELALMAKRRHASLARWTGAATGVGGIWTMIPDLAAVAWIQSRMVFYIAAAYGYDPRDPMRPAELLVLQRVYPDVGSAREALDGLGTTMAEQYIGNKLSRDEALFAKLAKLVARKSATKVAAKAIPFFAIAYNAVTDEKETRALANDAIRFYGG